MQPPEDEVGTTVSRGREERCLFVQKAFKLVQVILDNGRRKQAFQLLVLILSVLKRANERVSAIHLHNDHSALHKVITALMVGNQAIQTSTRATPNSSYPSLQPLFGSGVVGFEGLSWTRTPSDGVQYRYWDFASAARTLRAAYFHQLCRPSPMHSRINDPEFESENQSCFHTDTVELLDAIQIKSWSEIRASVFLSLGTIFATEITQRIFECALEAEEIPIDPKTTEVYLLEAPRIKVKRLQPGKQPLFCVQKGCKLGLVKT